MARLTAEALAAGALGFTTSRTPLHRSTDGELVPGTTADVEELLVISDAVREAGHGVIQMALHHPDVVEQLPWLRRLAARTGRRVTLNLQQVDEAPELWREVVAGLDAAAAAGEPLYAQAAGRPIGILMSWEGSLHPFLFRLAYQELAGLPLPERLAALRRPEVRERICAEQVGGLPPFLDALANGWHKMWPFAGETDYEPDPAASVAAVAERQGLRPAEVAYDALLAHGGEGLLYFPLFNYSHRSLDPLRELQQHPRVLMGLADAGAHCGAICDGSTPTFMVTFWTRDRERGERLPLELVVRRQTRDTAEQYGLGDRGIVGPGLRADLNVVDLDRLAIDAPRMAHDLPAGARRYVQRARGYRWTVCAGEVTVEDDAFTGARPGRLVRGPRH